MNLILLSCVLNYRTLEGLSSKYRVHYLFPEEQKGQMDIEFKELDRLSNIHRKNLLLYPLKKFFTLNSFLKTIGIIRKEKVDLLLTTSPLLGLMCLFFKIFFKKPYAIFIGQTFTELIILERPFYYRIFIPLYNIFMFISFRNADVLITHSRHLQNYVKSHGGRNIAAAYYYGVDTEFFKPVEVKKQGKFTVMYTGRFSLQKGVDHLIEAFKILKNRGFEFKALMCGEGSLKDTLLDVAEKNQINLELCGYLDHKTLAGKINQADVFVVPSLSEGLGFIAAEALSCGVPVIASNVGGLPDSVEGYGILVPPKDSKAIADAIVEVYDNYGEYKKKALEGRRHIIEKFDRKKVVREFQDALESVVKK